MIEVIATCIDDAVKIEKYGGQRIELISGGTEGGLTPSYALIKNVVQNVSIPVNVIIRPHAKSFIYSLKDIIIMKEDIQIANELGANGVVLGVIDNEQSIDEIKLQELLSVTKDLDVTFHKAIDETSDLVASVKVLMKYPQIKRILTSGGRGKIGNNFSIINKMVKTAKNKITIMLGGGMTKEILESAINLTDATDFHFGTAVRDFSSYEGDINAKALKEIVMTHSKTHNKIAYKSMNE